jgi:methionyl-tRNA synthetase
MSKYYLTTPIYYVNAAPHIGHTYTTVAADVIARYKSMLGFDVVLTTGTDEHGQKVERSAKTAGLSPEEFTTVIAEEFREQWRKLGLRIDRFMRTTDPRHRRVVQDLFRRCLAAGYVYKGTYTGQYCVYCELYVSDTSPGDPCPDCQRPTETVTEENYYFRLSAFQDKLLELYELRPDFIQPEIRRNEVLAFVKQGLNDLSISRTTIKWGIPVPDEEKHVFYVWFDALSTYMSAVDGEGRWPADLHLIGKEILRFHAVYWPAFLMAAGLPLPEKIFAHGWLLFEQDKMSKSRGNIVRATPIAEVIGFDALRYFLLREIVFGQDGNFSYDALVGRYNADLANGLGNLVSRTASMIRQYRQGAIPARPVQAGEPVLAGQAVETIAGAVTHFERLEFSRGLELIWSLLAAADKYIVEQAPWKLAKNEDPEVQAKLSAALYDAAEVVRIAAVLLTPVIPETCGRIWQQLGFAGSPEEVRLNELRWGGLPPGQTIGEPATLFPRQEVKVAVERMKALEVEETARQNRLLGKSVEPAEKATAGVTPAQESSAGTTAGAVATTAATEQAGGTGAPKISVDDFLKADLRVGVVVAAEPVKGADKLLHLHVDIGEPEPRSLVAGIAEAYRPEQIIGRKVVIVANLQPRKLRGIPSNGMIVAASEEGGKPVLVGFHEDVPVGARLK